MHLNELDLINQRLGFIEDLLRANKIHEKNCPAHSTLKGDFAGMFQGMSESQCDCWISLASPETDPTKGFAPYHLASETLPESIAFKTRAEVKLYVLKKYTNWNDDPESDAYWRKYMIPVSVSVHPAPLDETTEEL